MNDKVLVTNLTALKGKYGAAAAKITTAVDKLIAADTKRGLNTRLVALDDADAVGKLRAPPVTSAGDPKQNKMAIDAVYRALQPDYLVLLGSTDVIPHQDMRNPVYGPNSDPDRVAFGDLPYACDAPYSRKPEDFIGPTRVVGRLPDLTGAKDPAYVLDLLNTAGTWKGLPFSEYAAYLGISAAVWQGSTRLSLDNVFGGNADLRLSPTEGPKWSKKFLERRTHFVNCHGAEASPQFFGQLGNRYPVSHEAKLLEGNITPGTVVAAECCYGAQLYNSFEVGNGHAAICNTYLGNGAYGFFGSTTIAYGPAQGNGSADLICQYFLLRVLSGSSLGRAALEARQEFIASSAHMDPMDLKTLAQFCLLGDPSIHPVVVPTPEKAFAAGRVKAAVPMHEFARAERRGQLQTKGLYLANNQSVVSSSRAKTSVSVAAALKSLAKRLKIGAAPILSFDIKRRTGSKVPLAKAVSPNGFHVMIVTKPAKGPVQPAVCIVAKEIEGRIVSYRELDRR